MIDIVDKNKIHVKPDPNELLLAEVEVRDHDPKEKHREKTGGEVLFNRVVYTGIGFGVNEASTLVIADEFEHGIGKKLYDRASDWIAKTFNYKDIVKNGELITAKKSASSMLLYFTLLTSGTLLLWPMKKLEDSKDYWVEKANHWLDRRNGNLLSPEEVKARDDEVRKALACEAKQTWPALIIGRIAAVGAVMGFGALMGPDRTKKLLAGSEKLLTGSVAAEKNRTHRYAALIGLETTTCAISSLTLELVSKLFAKRGVTVRDPELCTAIVHHQVSEDKTGTTSAPTSFAPCASGSSNGSSGTPQNADEKEKYTRLKSKPVVRKESHADAVAASENFSLAP